MLFTLHKLMSPLAALFGVFIGLPFLLIPCNSQFNYLYRDSFRSSIYMPKRSQTSFLNFFLLSATHISPKKMEKKMFLQAQISINISTQLLISIPICMPVIQDPSELRQLQWAQYSQRE